MGAIPQTRLMRAVAVGGRSRVALHAGVGVWAIWVRKTADSVLGGGDCKVGWALFSRGGRVARWAGWTKAAKPGRQARKNGRFGSRVTWRGGGGILPDHCGFTVVLQWMACWKRRVEKGGSDWDAGGV